MTGEGADAFAELGPAVRAALSERGFDLPTAPQRRAIPPVVEGRDVLLIAPTGSGKTEAAMLPVFDALAEGGAAEGFGALYVTPLRALNRDMRERLEWWGDRLDLAVDVRHGDTTDYQRRKQVEDPPDVLVTTPETLQAMLTGSRLREALADVGHVVVDEVHELAAAKRGAQLSIGLERLRALAGPFQRVGLSATVGDPEEVGRFLTGDRGATVRSVDVGSRLDLQVTEPAITDEDADLAGTLVTDEETASHVRAIRDLVAGSDSTLIFVNTRQTAEALGSRFRRLDLPIGVHHGSLAKEARVEMEDRFKDGDLAALLCTSSMELGIDVGRVDHVVQYQSPRQVARLLQRVGRAGHRMDRTSTGTTVTTRPDDTFEAAAIARRATDGAVEPAAIHHGSLDVVANQVPGMVQGRDEIAAADAYRIVTAAYPFADLGADQFREILEELHGNRVVWYDAEAAPEGGTETGATEPPGVVETTGGTWQYVYQNLSMIPDEETYGVDDVTGGSRIGTLDERFVVTFAEPGEVFIQGGEMWRIVEIDEEEARVEVTPIDDPGGEVPSWIGQEIPVPEAVAREVGELRAVAGRQLADGAPREAVARSIAKRYPVAEDTLASALEQVEHHVETGAPVPTGERILIEGQGRAVVLNAAYGHEVNETLGRLLSSLLGQQVGASVAMDVDPYRIELELPSGLGMGEVRAVLRETDPDHVRPLIELSLKHSDTLKFRLSQVAATFGALKRWEGDGTVSEDRLLAALEDTPMYDEAVREVFHEDLAVEDAARILESIQDGNVDVETVRERTPIGRGGRSSGRELLAPENADASVVDTVRDRLMDDEVILLCVHCGDYDRTTTVGRVPEQPRCPECDSTRIAALNPWAEEVVRAVRANERDDEQEDMVERAHRAANLVQSHGKQAVIALAARGVGPENAARIIGKLREDERDFYRDILDREREYARTRSFWD